MQLTLIGRELELQRARTLLEDGTGVALVGVAGVGKSRLLHELLDGWDSTLTTVLTVAATESTRTIPFGPFADIVPAGPIDDRRQFYRGALEHVRSRMGPQGLLLGIDDAHHLDPGSLALVSALLAEDGIAGCMTVRSDEELPLDLVRLWTAGLVERVDIEALGHDRFAELVRAMLGPCTTELEDELWRLSAGNPLLLHELIEGASPDALRLDGNGVWHQAHTLATSARLTDLISARLRRIPPELRAAMALVAVGAPLPLPLLEELATEQVPELEQRRLITISTGADATVLPAHPLYGEVFREALGITADRDANRTLTTGAMRVPDVVDSLRAAIWQHDGGSIDHPDLAVAGARAALTRHDAVLAEQLVGPVAGHSIDAAILLGRALSLLHRFEQAEEVLRPLVATNDATRIELASVRAHNLAYGLGDPPAAICMLAAAAEQATDVGRVRLDTERGVIAAMGGDFSDAAATGRAILANDAATPASRAVAYVSLSLSLAMTGDCDSALGLFPDAYAAAHAARSEVPLAIDQLGVMQMCALCASGQIDDAVDLALRHAEKASGNAMESTWRSSVVMALDLAGRLQDGLASARIAASLMRSADPFGLERQVQGLIALLRGQLGDPQASEQVRNLEVRQDEPRVGIWVQRGATWAAAAQGDTQHACLLAAAGGRNALERQHVVWGAFALHDAVRLGDPHLVAEDLASVQDAPTARLLATMAAHAQALAARDHGDLLTVAERFASMSAPLLAAEAAAQASLATTGTAAVRACAWSIGWQRQCQEPQTPALLARPRLVSAREVQVAVEAARGRSSLEIADDLYLSPRTVDNHLQSAYRKLDVTGRPELPDVLAPLLSSGPPA